jgi:hypothetical protein
MKNRYLTLLLMMAAIAFSCKNSSPVAPTAKIYGPAGLYVVGGLERSPDITFEELEKSKLLEFGDSTFIFQPNDTLLIHPATGMEFFGDSVFRYEVTAMSLILTSKGKKTEIPYIFDGVYRLSLTHPLVKRLDLIHPQSKAQPIPPGVR